MPLSLGPSSAAAAENEEAVESGGEVLGRGWIQRTHPWYDSGKDDVDLIPLPKPKAQAAPSSWDWPEWMKSFGRWLTSGWDFSFFGWNFSINLLQIFMFLILALVLGIVIYYLSKLYAAKAKNQDATDEEEDDALSDADRIEALPFKVRPRDTDLLTQARELYQQGHYREAMILLFSHLLVEMDKHHVIRLAKGKTNRQYLREIGPRAALRAIVERTMIAFEAVFFGDHDLDQRGFEACWSQLDQFRQLVQSETA